MAFERIRGFFLQLTEFIKNLANDPRIPSQDKKILVGLVALIISPIDLIPDWIPIIGVLDDLVILAIVLDYFFEILDQEIILSHYPWGMKSYTWIRRMARVIASLTPHVVQKHVWKYRPDIYKKN